MIAVVDYHKGNLKSVERGLVCAGGDAHITDDPKLIRLADALVLPGVGAFTDAAKALEQLQLAPVIVDRVRAGVPFLGICLGLHMMFDAGEEHAEGAPTAGLGLLPGIVKALPRKDEAGNAYKIPHVGWNSISYPEEPCPLFAGIAAGEYFYFTHSYAVPQSEATVATTQHSIDFPCAVQAPGLPACFGVQFHPEKSSDAGQALLANFIRIAQAQKTSSRVGTKFTA